MKLSIDQQDFLRSQLQRNLEYRETYLEFYDHIMSALENKPQDMNLQDAINSIVDEDFGGYYGMGKIEDRYKKEITSEIKSRYKTYLMEFLKFPLVGITLSLLALFYWITQQPWFGYGIFLAILFGMRIAPRLVKGTRNIILWCMSAKPKRSAKDSVFQWLDYIPFIALVVIAIPGALNTPSTLVWYKSASPVCLTLILLTFAMHTLTYFRIYKNEFKTAIIQ